MKKSLLLLCAGALLTSTCYGYDAPRPTTPPKTIPDTERKVTQGRSAGKPTLAIAGAAIVHTNFSSPDVTYYNQDSVKSNKDSSKTRICAGETNIAFIARGALENGVIYGAVIDFDAMKDATGVDKMFITLAKDNLGTIEVGNVKGPAYRFLCGGQQLVGGTTGLDGTVPHDIDFSTGVISPITIIGYTNKASKAVFFSPYYYGWQFGIAITPDTKHTGHSDRDWHTGDSSHGNDYGLFMKGNGDKERPSGRNNIEVGLKHDHDYKNGFTSKVSFVWVTENSRPVTTNGTKISLRNANSYFLTGTVTYKQISVGAGYLNNRKSRLPVAGSDFDAIGGFIATKNSNAGSAWNVGAKYVFNDHWSMSAAYNKTQRRIDSNEKARGSMITATLDYKVCDGLLIFLEVDHISTKSGSRACELRNKSAGSSVAIRKQKSQLFALGAKVSF